MRDREIMKVLVREVAVLGSMLVKFIACEKGRSDRSGNRASSAFILDFG